MLTSCSLSCRPRVRCPLHVVCGESRIGKAPVPIPEGVEYTLRPTYLSVKARPTDSRLRRSVILQGPLGQLEHEFPKDIELVKEGDRIIVKRVLDGKKSKAMHGLSRALCNNMFVGVSRGYEKTLIMNGVGYRAAVEGEKLNLSVGFCHPVLLDIPKGVKVKVDEGVNITVSGFNKQVVGNFAAIVRSKRPPEPYKGKGIRYSDEVVKLKEGKRGK